MPPLPVPVPAEPEPPPRAHARGRGEREHGDAREVIRRASALPHPVALLMVSTLRRRPWPTDLERLVYTRAAGCPWAPEAPRMHAVGLPFPARLAGVRRRPRMPRGRINRRTVLRGALGGLGISVALPPLEAMFNGNGDRLRGRRRHPATPRHLLLGQRRQARPLGADASRARAGRRARRSCRSPPRASRTTSTSSRARPSRRATSAATTRARSASSRARRSSRSRRAARPTVRRSACPASTRSPPRPSAGRRSSRRSRSASRTA